MSKRLSQNVALGLVPSPRVEGQAPDTRVFDIVSKPAEGATMGAQLRFREVLARRHEYARTWKERKAGRVIGYLCTYTPEELLYAAGALPVRILASGEAPGESERYVSASWCQFSRDCLAQGIRGEYAHLDGLVTMDCCYDMAECFDAWRSHVPTPYAYFINAPWSLDGRAARSFWAKELQAFKSSLEGLTGNEITPSALEEAIAICNTNRRLLHRLYDLRKEASPPLRGRKLPK